MIRYRLPSKWGDRRQFYLNWKSNSRIIENYIFTASGSIEFWEDQNSPYLKNHWSNLNSYFFKRMDSRRASFLNTLNKAN